jgi:hypothetical protein
VLLFYTRRRFTDLAAIAVGAVPAAALLIAFSLRVKDVYWSPAVFSQPDVWYALKQLAYRFWVHLSGSYYMWDRREAGSFSELAANLWLGMAVLLAASAVVQAWRRRFFTPSQAALLAVLGTLSISLLMNRHLFSYRYMLPTTGFLAIALGLELPPLLAKFGAQRKALTVTTAALVLAGAAAFIEVGRIPLSSFAPRAGHTENEAAQALVDELLSHGVHHVYSTDHMLQWTVMFASREQIIARWISPTDRCPEYPRQVDRALLSGQRVAIIGHVDELLDMAGFLGGINRLDLEPHVIKDTFWVVYDPGRDIVRAMYFRLNE